MKKMKKMNVEEMKKVTGGWNEPTQPGRGGTIFLSDNNCSNNIGLPATIIGYAGGGQYICKTL